MCKVVGLTGPSGAGKSAVSAFLRSCGYHVVDCDLFAKQAMDSDEACQAKLQAAFSDCFEHNKLNRRKLGKLVFSDKEKLKLLNSIANPVILSHLNAYLLENSGQTVILDGATVIQSGAASLCDELIGVLADRQTRVNRIMKRDGLSQTDAENRIDSQDSDSFFKEHCTYILYNNRSLEDVCGQVQKIIEEVVK